MIKMITILFCCVYVRYRRMQVSNIFIQILYNVNRMGVAWIFYSLWSRSTLMVCLFRLVEVATGLSRLQVD